MSQETATRTVHRRITTEFVAMLAGVNANTVRYCIRNEIFPYCEFAAAYKEEDDINTRYAISPGKLAEHFPYTPEELEAFYEQRRGGQA